MYLNESKMHPIQQFMDTRCIMKKRIPRFANHACDSGGSAGTKVCLNTTKMQDRLL
jgi:hypothetical protein